MKLTIVISIFLISLTSCVTQEKNNRLIAKSFQDFKQIQFDNSSILSESWGQPAAQRSTELDGQLFTLWQYENVDKLIYAQFLIDPTTKKIVEKTYLPSTSSAEFNLKKLLDVDFKNISFEKIAVKCRHNNEIVYFNKLSGIFVMAKQTEYAKTDAISYSVPAVFNLRIKENKNKKCW